jgi:hypothetical protein
VHCCQRCRARRACRPSLRRPRGSLVILWRTDTLYTSLYTCGWTVDPPPDPWSYAASTAWQPSWRHAPGVATASQQALARASRSGWVKRGWDEHADVPFLFYLAVLDGFVLLCPVEHGREAEHSWRKRSHGAAARPLVALLPFPLRCCSTSWPPSAAPVLLRVTTTAPFAGTEPQPRPPATAPPRTTTGALSNPSNPQNGTLGEQGPFPHPFPAKHCLPLAGIRPSSPLAVPGTTLQRSRSFQGPRCKNQGPVHKS